MDSREAKRQHAAKLVADRKQTVPAIAEAVGCSPRTINTWKGEADFIAMVESLRVAWRAKAHDGGISDTDWAIRHIQDRHTRLRAIIEARAKDPEHRKAPGGKTGMLTITYKMRAMGDKLGHEMVPEYAFDAALNEAMLAAEVEVQTLLGKYKQKVEVAVTGVMSIIERLHSGRKRVADEKAQHDSAA